MTASLVDPITVSADRNYRVRAGDTLSGIARRFRVSVASIQRANRLRGTSVREGQRLRIPTGGSRDEARRRGEHLVRQGETLSGVASRYRVSVRALARANRLRSESLRVGQRLRIPGRRSENPMPREEPAPDNETHEADAQRAQALGVGGLRTAHRLLGETPDPTWITAASQAPMEVPEAFRELDPHGPHPRTAEGTLLHPLIGEEHHFMRGWGSGRGGYHLALDLYARPGSPIRSAERGLIAYAGTGVRGYGRFVIVVHPSGRVTAYAHNRQLLVRAGQLVAQGQVIAQLGNTGLSRGPHLHFMLIDGGDHCDAAPLLRPIPIRRNGEPAVESESAWTDARPEAVQCLRRNARPHPRYRRRR